MPRRSLLSKTEHSTAPLRSLPNKGEAIRGRFPGGPFPLPRPLFGPPETGQGHLKP